ncbi:MAG: WYL domain-containing protein [Kofleriaceae bacterium]
MTRLERLVAIALFLGNRRRVLARDVADHFDVSLRTVYRDMRALTKAGYPVEGNAGDGYRLRHDSYLRPLALTGGEAEALAIAARAYAASSEQASLLMAAATKLEAVLDPNARHRSVEIQRKISIPDYAHKIAPSTAVLDSIRERRALDVVYDDPKTGKRSARAIEPLGLVCMGDAWWLVAYCRLKQGARAFRVDRLSRVTLGATFELRAGFSFGEIAKRDAKLARSLFGS